MVESGSAMVMAGSVVVAGATVVTAAGSSVLVVQSLVDLQVLEHLLPERTLGEHAPDGLFENAFRELLELLGVRA